MNTIAFLKKHLAVRPQTAFAGIVFVYLIGFLTHALIVGKTVYGDGVFYYGRTRSVVVDRDTSYANEYAYFGMTQPPDISGKPGNKYALGPSLAWIPAVAAVHNAIHGDGYGWHYQLAVGLTGVAAAIAGLALVYRMLASSYTESIALTATLAIAFATNLWFYGSLDTVNSHALSFLAVASFLSILWTPGRSWLAAGVALGTVFLMRPADVTVGLFVLPFLSSSMIVPFLTGIAAVSFPQLVSWQSQTGSFLTTPYARGGEGFDLLHPHLLGVLAHPVSGWFFRTPMTLTGGIGFLLTPVRKAIPLRSMFGVVAVAVYLTASWSTWWQGATYGSRFLVSVLPLVAFGIAEVARRMERLWGVEFVRLTLVLSLAAINAVSILAFLIVS